MITRKLALMMYQSTDLDNSKEKSNIFHYTSTEVLDALLTGCTFRASNVFYLNDSEEYKAGITALKDIAQKAKMEKTAYTAIQNTLDSLLDENGRGLMSEGIFTISFSLERDLLSQWVTYAKEGGVAIELDSQIIEDYHWFGVEKSCKEIKKNSVGSEDDELLFFPLEKNLNRIKYEYNPAELSEVIESSNKELFMWVASYFKKKGFSQEKEMRISVLPVQHDTDKENKAEVKYYYMNGRGVLRPYLNIIFGCIEGDEFKPSLPIKTITVGPARNQQAVFNSVVHRIKYGNCNIFNYGSNNTYLKENILNYIQEILVWLNAEGHINLLLNSSGKSAADIDDLIDNKVKKAKRKWIRCIIKALVENLEATLGIAITYFNKTGIADLDNEQKIIIQDIYDNFYFSKEGVLIKKSEIPYIY